MAGATIADGRERHGEEQRRARTGKYPICLLLMVCAGFDLTYSDLSWNGRRSARMSLTAKGTWSATLCRDRSRGWHFHRFNLRIKHLGDCLDFGSIRGI